MRKVTRNFQAKAFTLLEMMIALSMGLFLLIGIVDIFDATRQSYRYIQGLALIQENGQLASYILVRELSQAGYVGCRKMESNFPVQQHISTTLNPSVLIHGYNSQNLPGSVKIISKNM